MPWIRLLLLTALLASPALPGHATEGRGTCTDRAVGADSDAVSTCARSDAMAVSPDATPGALPVESLGLDCNPFVLGGLASGAAASGLQASALLNATIRQCSLRGYVFGLAMQSPINGPDRR